MGVLPSKNASETDALQKSSVACPGHQERHNSGAPQLAIHCRLWCNFYASDALQSEPLRKLSWKEFFLTLQLLRSLYYDRSIASTKASSPQRAI
jgi:hypothetical protein